ncbi:cysteine synthase A [Paenibacillus sp. UNCCL117]|uniref:2,3-diaminopropionate biosynthesis protein SbnA n=1 Tax=unclassified Paenibacillus TaxID=185978 RepID=UPI00088B9E8D|nr:MULTISPECIES: 2,3-diaminopropionate biosynthesis protein SbnA [unclassified Paenibacillus]SDE61836.1 cysteine synthase A [Paenibacillus sp. cl123]SFW69829.1 cysteine synthase A [Paenibacillus sp. UNCCL117]
MKLEGGLTDTIGRTPLVKLERLFAASPFSVYAKLEGMNPGGSAKDRPALYMLKEAIRRGELTRDSVVIESSSGNLAISLAQLCCRLGLRFICVVDPRTTEQHKRIIRSLRGEIDLVTEPDPQTGEFLPARIRRVQELLSTVPHAYWTNQYGNPDNYRAHMETTMAEIAERLGRVDYLFCGVSSCGTIRGCKEYVRDRQMETRIVAVDAEGSVLFGGWRGPRKLPGLGAGITPALHRAEAADLVVRVSDIDCVRGCRELVRCEAILAGASSGGVVSAVGKLAGVIPADAVCVVVLPDRGERYLDTIYDDEWVRRELRLDPESLDREQASL